MVSIPLSSRLPYPRPMRGILQLLVVTAVMGCGADAPDASTEASGHKRRGASGHASGAKAPAARSSEAHAAPSTAAPPSTGSAPAAPDAPVETHGLVRSADGLTIRDENQHVVWVAQANLAADPAMRAKLGVDGVKPNGTMSYATAVKWVAALNAQKYLGRSDWQLPTTPTEDPGCAVPGGRSGNAFGPGCKASALGSLYSVGFGATFPSGIIGRGSATVGPVRNLQQGLYWSGGKDSDKRTEADSPNAFTFTFTSGARGRNTTAGNYFYVLPMVRGAIGGHAPEGTGLSVYTEGPAKGLAVYDHEHKLSWALDANLAATSAFGLSGSVKVSYKHGDKVELPVIASSGAMRFAAALDWVKGMNGARYAGSSDWSLPSVPDLQGLHQALSLDSNYAQLLSHGRGGPFDDLQRFFYWSCQRGPGDSRSPCTAERAGPSPNDAASMYWAFNFQSGFQGTDEENKEFFVMVYHPEP